MRALAIAGVAIALVLGTAAGASSTSKDCGNGPSSFPGNGTPAGGHFVRCSKPPPAPPPVPPPPPPEPPVEQPPPSEPPAVSVPTPCSCGQSPEPRHRHRREPLRASRPTPTFEHPPTETGGSTVVIRARPPEPTPITPELLGVVLLFGGAAGLSLFIAGHPGPSPTFGLGGR